MLICPRCGKDLRMEDKFCGFCGFNLAARETTEMVTRQSLKVSDVQFNLGVIYFREGKYPQALEIFEKALKENPDNIRVREMYDQTVEILENS